MTPALAALIADIKAREARMTRQPWQPVPVNVQLVAEIDWLSHLSAGKELDAEWSDETLRREDQDNLRLLFDWLQEATAELQDATAECEKLRAFAATVIGAYPDLGNWMRQDDAMASIGDAIRGLDLIEGPREP
jgi:hypothetical protein